MSKRLVPLPDGIGDKYICAPCLEQDRKVRAVICVVDDSGKHPVTSGLCANHAEVFTEEDTEIEKAVKDVHRLSQFISPEIEIERDVSGSYTFRY